MAAPPSRPTRPRPACRPRSWLPPPPSPPRRCRCAPMAPRSNSSPARARTRRMRRSGRRARSSTPATIGSRFSCKARRRWPMSSGRISASARPTTSSSRTGAGSNVLGCDIGFGELLRRGEIARLPRLFAVQPANCAPLHAGLRRGRGGLPADRAEADDRRGNRDRAACARPRSRSRRSAARAARRLPCRKPRLSPRPCHLARSGLYAEPTSARSPPPACRRSLREGAIGTEETTVVVLTGSGLKATQRWGELIEA